MRSFGDYIGIPYGNRGRTHAGCDCYGLISLIYADMRGIILDPLDGYSNSDDAKQVQTVIEKESRHWLKVDKPKVYDVIVFRMKGKPCHVGMYIGGGKFIHSLKNRNSCVERLNNAVWVNLVEGYYANALR